MDWIIYFYDNSLKGVKKKYYWEHGGWFLEASGWASWEVLLMDWIIYFYDNSLKGVKKKYYTRPFGILYLIDIRIRGSRYLYCLIKIFMNRYAEMSEIIINGYLLLKMLNMFLLMDWIINLYDNSLKGVKKK